MAAVRYNTYSLSRARHSTVSLMANTLAVLRSVFSKAWKIKVMSGASVCPSQVHLLPEVLPLPHLPDRLPPDGHPDRAAGQDVEGVPRGALPHDVLALGEHLGLQHVTQSGQHHARQPGQQRHTLQEVYLHKTRHELHYNWSGPCHLVLHPLDARGDHDVLEHSPLQRPHPGVGGGSVERSGDSR